MFYGELKHTPPSDVLSTSGREYWQHRQDGAYVNWRGTLAAYDGSAAGSMGAAAVLRDHSGILDTQVCKVGGP